MYAVERNLCTLRTWEQGRGLGGNFRYSHDYCGCHGGVSCAAIATASRVVDGVYNLVDKFFKDVHNVVEVDRSVFLCVARTLAYGERAPGGRLLLRLRAGHLDWRLHSDFPLFLLLAVDPAPVFFLSPAQRQILRVDIRTRQQLGSGAYWPTGKIS